MKGKDRSPGEALVRTRLIRALAAVRRRQWGDATRWVSDTAAALQALRREQWGVYTEEKKNADR